jgi:hypothetical protein
MSYAVSLFTGPVVVASTVRIYTYIAQAILYAPSTPLTDIPNWFPEDTTIGLDTPQATGVKFWYPNKASATDSVQFAAGESYPIDPSDDALQVIQESGSGKVSVYDSTWKRRVIPVHLEQLTTTQRMRFYRFFNGITKRAMRSFQFEDEGGNLYTVRFWGSILAAPMEWWLNHTFDIDLRKEV